MKNVFKFMAKSKWSILAIFILLIAQAYCDLSLPGLTSDLLNIGLQQGGIENAVMETVSSESLSDISLFLSEEDTSLLWNTYYPEEDENGIRALNKDADLERLNEMLLIPESMLYQMSQSEEAKAFSLEDTKTALTLGVITKDQILEGMKPYTDKFAEMPESVLNQVAVNYVSAEYASQGLDLDAIRNKVLIRIGIKMLLMSLFMTVTAFASGLIASVVAAKIGKDLRQSLFEKVLAFTDAEMEKFSTASLITRATNDIQQIQMVCVILLRMVAYAPILAVGGIISIIGTHSGMTWIIVLAVAILLSVIAILIMISMPKFKIMQTLVDRLNLVAREMLNGIMPIRAFSRERHEEARFDVANKDLYSTQFFTTKAISFMFPAMMFVMNGVSVLIVWVGAHKVDLGNLQVGDLTAFITYSMVIVISFLMMSMVFVFLPRAGIAANRIVEVLNTEVVLTETANPKDDELSDAKGVVEFNDVSFKYPGAEEMAVEHISFTAKPGQTTAIIGSTGCGKSTILKLIPRFSDVTEGSISIDGIDIRDLSTKKLREMLGYVPQKGMLFSGTIESNLKFADEAIPDEDMKLAAEISQSMEFIDSKEDKFESPIAQGGSNVSGGQKQRLSIARAIAKKPKVFLFDDSFSALDYRTDLALRKAISEKLKDATVIIVAQRISTILHAEQIIVLDEGRIAAIGTHDKLMKECEIYREIAKSQLSDAELAASNKESMEGGMN